MRAIDHSIHNGCVDRCVLKLSVTGHVTRNILRKKLQQPILKTYSTYGRDMRRERRSGVILPDKRVTRDLDASKPEDSLMYI